MTKPKRPTKDDLEKARQRKVPDVIAPRLKLLFVGINPGLYSAAVGHHFARPGNRFWPALYESGFTRRQLQPHEERELLDIGLGVTNIVERASARADELTKNELADGVRRLEKKVRKYEIANVAFLGLTAYRSALDRPQTNVGKTGDRLADAPVWALPNPSGLNAHYQRSDFARLFRKLRKAVS